MTKGNWLHRVALGALLVALAGSPHAQQQQQPERPAEPQRQANPAPDLSPTLRSIFNEAVEILAREKAEGADAEKRKEDREKADLNAQQEQSLWAQIAALAACIALFVNGLTLWFLWRTFRETKRTADGAVRAANAAEDAVSVTSDTAKRQLRAYMSAAESRLDDFETDKVARSFIVFRNTGQTPAYDVRSRVALRFVNTPVTDFDLVLTGEESSSSIGPGLDIHPGISLPAMITSSHMSDFYSGKKECWFYGWVKYRDAFGEQRETNFRYFLDMESALSGRFAWSVATEGNDAT